MKIIRIIRQNKTIVFLSVVLLLIILLKSSPMSRPVAPPKEAATPAPAITASPPISPLLRPTLAPQPPPVSQAVLNKIISELPYQTQKFDIQYYPQNKSFVVTVKKGPLDQTISQAKDWFQSQGVEDLSSLKIMWQPTREVLNEAGALPPIPEL